MIAIIVRWIIHILAHLCGCLHSIELRHWGRVKILGITLGGCSMTHSGPNEPMIERFVEERKPRWRQQVYTWHDLVKILEVIDGNYLPAPWSIGGSHSASLRGVLQARPHIAAKPPPAFRLNLGPERGPIDWRSLAFVRPLGLRKYPNNMWPPL